MKTSLMDERLEKCAPGQCIRALNLFGGLIQGLPSPDEVLAGGWFNARRPFNFCPECGHKINLRIIVKKRL